MNNIGKNVDSMNFEELRSFVKVLANSVQELSDLYAKTKREYNDMLYNLSRENLSIEYIQEEKEFVNSTVGDKMKDYSTIEQTEEKIKLTVGSSVSSLKQYSDAELEAATKADSIADMEWQDKIYFIENNDGSKTYYVYNPLLQIWTPIINYVGQKYSTIEQTDEKIASSVISNKEYVDTSLIKYSTTEQTAEMIQSKVEEEIGNAGGGIDLTQYTRIDQTADAITQTAYRGINLGDALYVTDVESMNNPDMVYYLSSGDEYNGERTYFAYNSAVGKFLPITDGQSIYTVFEQTAEGFEFKGNVIIDGDAVVTKNLKAQKIVSQDGNEIALLTMVSNGESKFPDLTYYGKINGSYRELFGIRYDGTGVASIRLKENTIGYVGSELGYFWPQGTWNFSSQRCEVIGLGVVPVFE